MSLGRHRGGQFPDPLQVLGPKRTRAPGVVIGRREPGQQQAPRRELEGEHGGGAPEDGGRVCLRGGTRAREDRQRGAYGQQHGGYGLALGTGVSGYGEAQLLGRAGLGVRRPSAIGVPEGDSSFACRVTGHEDSAAADQFGDLGECCHGTPVGSDDVFLKFDYRAESPRVPHDPARRAASQSDAGHSLSKGV